MHLDCILRLLVILPLDLLRSPTAVSSFFNAFCGYWHYIAINTQLVCLSGAYLLADPGTFC